MINTYKIEKTEIVGIAKKLLRGTEDYVLASRRIVGLIHKMYDNPHDFDEFKVFIAIDSSTDHLPREAVRKHWNKKALTEKDAEYESIYDYYKKPLSEACRKIIEMWWRQ